VIEDDAFLDLILPEGDEADKKKDKHKAHNQNMPHDQ
jgi:hypothetical protein